MTRGNVTHNVLLLPAPLPDTATADRHRCPMPPRVAGRIVRKDAPRNTVEIYGFSMGFGGDEGGPPGRGMRDHAEVAELVREALPTHTVSHSPDGY